jgi:formylglycine-generating enzyme required for sulfatase activity
MKSIFKTISTMILVTMLLAACASAAGASQVREKDGMVMVYVAEGSFTMGSNNGNTDEKPERRETLPGFWIDQTEVTNGMYEKCEQAGKCQPPAKLSSDTRDRYYGTAGYADYPVIYVDWNRAKTYCLWAGGRLPSEAEWEKAARGTDGRAYPWGDKTPNSSLANYDWNEGDTTEVGRYSPEGDSIYGAKDMAGNVWEWTADWYDVYPEGDPQASDYFGTQARVLRGGSWYSKSNDIRSADRLRNSPSLVGSSYGFRCALSSP